MIALLAQTTNPFGPLFATLAGLVAAAVAALMGAVVGIATLMLVWRLLKETMSDPKPGKLGSLVGVMCLAVALAGAAPGFLGAAFTWGKTLGDQTNSGAGAAVVQAEG